LQTAQNVNSSGVNLSRFDYEYDATGQITSWSKLLGTAGLTFWFDYDAGQQLVGARNAADPSAVTQRCDYGYDEAGNRTLDSEYDPGSTGPNGWATGTFVTYTSNEVNELDTRSVQVNNGPPTVSSLSYDLAGNLTDDGGGMTFEWDGANRLVAINYTGTAKRSEFTYDGLNRRVKVVEKNGGTITSTKRFVWSGPQIVQERDANDAVTRRYFGEGEERIGGDGEAQNYYYTRDHLGSIREVVNSHGDALARYEYDPYGKRTILPSKIEVDFGYGGHYYHAPSGLNLVLYRAYSSVLGRWLSRDPIGERGGMNLYEDVQNDPINRIDPLGLLGFRYYGNWGGPGWTGGQTRPYEELTPLEVANLAPPIDAQDRCYMEHDICFSQCRTKNHCTAKTNPTRGQRKQETTCEGNCDYYLAACLRDLDRQNWHSRLGWSFFTWRSTVR
jgi:RHS repeat-associated protein